MMLLLLTSLAHADVPVGDAGIYTTGDLRWIGALPPALVVDDDGRTLQQGFVLDQRIRLGGGLSRERLRLDLEGDLLEGQIIGQPWGLGPGDERNRDQMGVLNPDSFSLRKASVTGLVGPVQLSGGVKVSDWGLGLLANNGARDPLFGRSDFGDRVIRVSATLLPINDIPLFISLAGDRVIEDELGRWDEGQQIYQGIASALWRPPEGATFGVYGVYRDQLEADRVRRTQAGVMDGFADVPIPLSDRGHQLNLAAEGAVIWGHTSRASSYNSPDGLDVLAGGFVAQAAASLPEDRATLHLRGGWASGDGDPDDGVTNDFAFDRDCNAGMLLFDEVQGALAAASYQQISDPANSGTPPDGAEVLLTEGAIQRATYTQVAAEVQPRPWLNARLGALMAWQTAPISYGFETYRNGGVPSNQLGQPTTGNQLGTEIDWALRLGGHNVGTEPLQVRPELLLQGAHLFASADISPDPLLHFVMVSGRLRW